MTGSELSKICVCPVVNPRTVQTARCIGAKPIHKNCGGVVEWWNRSKPISEIEAG